MSHQGARALENIFKATYSQWLMLVFVKVFYTGSNRILLYWPQILSLNELSIRILCKFYIILQNNQNLSVLIKQFTNAQNKILNSVCYLYTHIHSHIWIWICVDAWVHPQRKRGSRNNLCSLFFKNWGKKTLTNSWRIK